MVAQSLVDSKIDAGRRLIEELDLSDFRVDAALWLFREESANWRLILASPLFDSHGPKETYRRLQNILAKLDYGPHDQSKVIGLSEIQVASPKDELIQLLRVALRTGPTLSGIRFTGNTINGVFIDDAYIYRM